MYIKLGQSGIWERSCLLEDQTVRLGYQQYRPPFAIAAARSGDWREVERVLMETGTRALGAARRHVVQIRQFFEADETVLWVTFFQHRLWWRGQTLRSLDRGLAQGILGRQLRLRDQLERPEHETHSQGQVRKKGDVDRHRRSMPNIVAECLFAQFRALAVPTTSPQTAVHCPCENRKPAVTSGLL
jgi:hypothetical protein